MNPDPIERGTDQPVYVQLAAILRRRIESGEIAERRPLPSKSRLRQDYGISDDTIDKALAILREEGKIRTVTGLGIFATPRGEWRGPP